MRDVIRVHRGLIFWWTTCHEHDVTEMSATWRQAIDKATKHAAADHHRLDCPALFFADHPERCRCMYLALIDKIRPPTQPRVDDLRAALRGDADE